MARLSPAELMKKVFSSEASLQRWMDAEAALARAEASLQVIPESAAFEISRKAKAELLDTRKIEEIRKKVSHPVMSFILAFQSICEGDAGQYIHWGATSQDIQDTASILGLKEAYKVIYQSLRRIEDDLLNMSEKYADTIMPGRTHFIHALPITFGYKVAIWAREIRRHIERLKECRKRLLVGQLSGAVGTMASFGEKGPKIQALFVKNLGLQVPDMCWHASRDRSAEFANLLAMIATTLGRIFNDIRRLMSTEIGEVAEPWKMGMIGSSTMPHKRNPEVSEMMFALAKKVRYNAGLVTEVMVVEHERDLCFWLAEMDPLAESCVIMGELLTNAEKMAKGLVVYPERMKKNLDALKGLMLAEAVMLELGRKVGRQAAHEIVYENAMEALKKDVHYKQVLMNDSRVTEYLTEADIDRLLDPKNYVGFAPQIARDMVALSRKERQKD